MSEDSKAQPSVKNKQLTGSSKRKRKHSIKRNIVATENSNCSDSNKSSKVEKNYGKKAKAEKSEKVKSEKDSDDEAKEIKDSNNHAPSKQIKNQKINSASLKTVSSEEKCKNLRSSDSTTGQCSSAKQKCQNCKFCSEHEENQDSVSDSKEKQTKNKKKFTCEICAKGGSTRVYNSVEKHKHHLATAHEIYSEEIKRFECTDCSETVWFPTKAKLTYHLGTKHPGVLRFVCEVCTETFILKANYKSHLKTHNLVVPKKFSCDVCNGSFVNKAGYEAHRKRFPGPHIKQSCSHCGFSFSREKHMKNHRCKTLLLEAAEKASKTPPAQVSSNKESKDPVKLPVEEVKIDVKGNQSLVEKKAEASEADTSKKLTNDGDVKGNKRVVFHRIIPKRNQDQAVYRPVQVQAQNGPESLVVQELREIDLEGGTFIATPANEPEQQFIVRDLNGHLLQGNQILQLDINDVQQEENQVYLADWNIVAPYVIREKSP